MRTVDNWIDSYMELYSSAESPEVYVRWSAITAVAAALQRKVMFNRGFLSIYPNLFVVLVGPGAIGKGVSMHHARNLLAELGIPMCSEKATERGLINQMLKCRSVAEKADGTHISHSSLTLFAPEITVFFKRQQTEIIDTLCDIYDSGTASGGSWTVSTGMYGEQTIQNLWFSFIGGMTPDNLQKLVLKDVIGSGLSSRIIFIYADKRVRATPFPTFTDTQQALFQKLKNDLNEIYKLVGDFIPSKQFIKRYSEWYLVNKVEENYPIKDKKFHAYCDRRVGLHLPKLCMIVSAARRDDLTITEEDFDIALKYLLEAEESMPLAFSGVGRMGELGAIMFEVKEKVRVKQVVRYSKLLEEYQFEIEEGYLWGILQTLVRTGQVTLAPVVIKGDTKGFKYYRDNPREALDWEIRALKLGTNDE